ncbi:MAG: hypothetical protein AAGA77_15910 [Bacteroidota bacterium]
MREEFQIIVDINQHFTHDTDPITVPDNTHTKSLRTVLQSEEAKKIKQDLQQARKKYEHNKSSFGWMQIAASIIFIFMLGTAVYFFMCQDKENLYAKFYDPADLPSIISRSSSDATIEQAVIAFQNQNFVESLTFMDQIKDTLVQKEIPYLLYYGMASLENGDITEALAKFDAVINSKSIDRSKGYWFKALVYLKIGDMEKATGALKEILDHRDSFNHKKARELLNDIED